MKFMIASDIHGSEYFCKKMLEAYEREQADRLLLLGDLLYHGPRNELPREYSPKGVISLLNPFREKIFCVRGNCDSEVDQMVLEFPIMAEFCLISAGDRLIYATHGHVYNESSLPPLQKGDILLNGHTHIPKCTEYESFVYMNPGSVSIPKGESDHGYMTFDGAVFNWKKMDGSITAKYSI